MFSLPLKLWLPEPSGGRNSLKCLLPTLHPNTQTQKSLPWLDRNVAHLGDNDCCHFKSSKCLWQEILIFFKNFTDIPTFHCGTENVSHEWLTPVRIPVKSLSTLYLSTTNRQFVLEDPVFALRHHQWTISKPRAQTFIAAADPINEFFLFSLSSLCLVVAFGFECLSMCLSLSHTYPCTRQPGGGWFSLGWPQPHPRPLLCPIQQASRCYSDEVSWSKAVHAHSLVEDGLGAFAWPWNLFPFSQCTHSGFVSNTSPALDTFDTIHNTLWKSSCSYTSLRPSGEWG